MFLTSNHICPNSIDGVRKKNIIFIHLDTQYVKTNCKNEIYVKNWVRRIWAAKVNSREKVNFQSQFSVNGQSQRESMVS